MNDKQIIQKETEIVSVPTETKEVEITDEFVKKLEKNIGAYRKLINIALRLTTEEDWVNQNGIPYLECAGAEKIANPFGVKVTNQRSIKREFNDKKGDYYIWEYTATFSSDKLGRDMEISGMASSRDKFFAKETIINEKTGHKLTVLKPLEDIDEVNIMKKAQTNMMVNGIKRLLGLRNLTWDQLKEAGLNVDNIVKVTYQEKKKVRNIEEKKNEKIEKKEKLFE